MAVEIVMPRLGWTMAKGTLVEWRRRPGDRVEAGEILFVVESDKALQDVETFGGGTLHVPQDAPRPGDTVPVGTVLGYLLAEGEGPPDRVPGAPRPVSPVAEPPPAAAAHTPSGASASQPSDRPGPAISPRARRLAERLGVDWREVTGTSRTGRITEDDIRAAAEGEAAAGTT